MKILVTAFEPFGQSGRNSSLETMMTLPDKIGECEIIKLMLPVIYDECAGILIDKIQRISPSAAVCLGQAEGRGMITPEYIAVNVKHSSLSDNAGKKFTLEPIIPGAPDGYITTLPVGRITENMKNAGYPAAVSFTAGTFVCNDLMYQAIHFCRPLGIRAGFIHLPLSYEIASAEGKAGRVLTLPQHILTDGITSALAVVYAECL